MCRRASEAPIARMGACAGTGDKPIEKSRQGKARPQLSNPGLVFSAVMLNCGRYRLASLASGETGGPGGRPLLGLLDLLSPLLGRNRVGPRLLRA